MCPLQMVLPRRPYPLRSPSPRHDMHLRLHRALPHRRERLLRARAAPIAKMAPPHALPHAHRADRLIKKKTQGKRNLPDNEAVTKWRIIETLERATPEEIVQFAFALCAP